MTIKTCVKCIRSAFFHNLGFQNVKIVNVEKISHKKSWNGYLRCKKKKNKKKNKKKIILKNSFRSEGNSMY